MQRSQPDEHTIGRLALIVGAVVLAVATTAAVLAIRALITPDTAPDLVDLPDGQPALAGHIASVTDGDTVVIDFDGAGSERVRLLGIDTPETVKPNSPVECWGPEASARAEELLPPGTEVLVRRDVEVRDRYGRLLLHVWRADDALFVNQTLVEEGHAETLVIPPNIAHRARFSAAAARAREQGLGLWGHCPPEP